MKRWNWRAATGAFSGVLIACFILGLHDVSQIGITNLASNVIVNVVVDLMGIMVVFFLMLSCMLDDDIKDPSGTYFRIIMFLEGATLFLDEESWIMNGIAKDRIADIVVNTVYYCNSILMVLAFWFFMNRSESLTHNLQYKKVGVVDLVVHTLAFIGLVPIVLNPWTGWIFTIDSDGVYHRQEFFFFTLVIPFIIMMITTVYISKSKKGIRHKLSLYMYVLFPLIATLVQFMSYGLSLMYMGVLAAIILVYTNVYSQRGRELALQGELLAKQNLQLMVSQIQPHFIYNTLGTIRGLCKVNPDLAGKTVENFSKYLRSHLDVSASMERASIPIDQEIENTKVYTEIEQVRFPGIEIIYDIQDRGFDVPAFSVQPMVENAIKHGIRSLKEGKVWVKTFESGQFHVIEIVDNGVGIELTKEAMDPKRSHIGMSNVRERVEKLAGGRFQVESEVNKGTTIRMSFPITHLEM